MWILNDIVKIIATDLRFVKLPVQGQMEDTVRVMHQDRGALLS